MKQNSPQLRYKDCAEEVCYANMSVRYTARFYGCKNDNFQFNCLDFPLIFAQNTDRRYTLEPPKWGGSNEYPQSMF